jgi:hypothetical protein
VSIPPAPLELELELAVPVPEELLAPPFPVVISGSEPQPGLRAMAKARRVADSA